MKIEVLWVARFFNYAEDRLLIYGDIRPKSAIDRGCYHFDERSSDHASPRRLPEEAVYPG
jgi:hypothetical protein